jgi:glycosyltransferase involved in cell wall biosynthesis/predicted negative regulator of RcsB-dependent stress response
MDRFKSPARVILIAVVVGAAVLAGLIYWNAQETQRVVEAARQSSRAVPDAEIDKAKTREEYISKRYENDSRDIIVNYLLTNVGPAIALIGALGGGLIALYGYIDARRKEALDRSASDLKDTLTHLAGKEPQERVVGVVGLQHFLVADRGEFHRAALTALVAAARTEAHPEVLHSIRIAIEQAMRAVRKEVLTQVSWQNVRANRVDLAGLHLEGLDLRDVELRDAHLEGTWLSGAKLNAAQLQGARLDGAHLDGADLTYADLAGASLASADLRRAKFSRALVLDLDLSAAKLEGIDVEWETVPWEQSRNWRNAHFDPALKDKLVQRFGPAPSGPRILMLMWEIPPFVARGTWTACYHFARNLVHRGADLTIVVPWNDASILTAPFGSEVKVVPMGIRLPQQLVSPYTSGVAGRGGQSSFYGQPPWSAYADPARSPYGTAAWSPYAAPAWSPYSGLAARSYGGPGPYGGTYNPYASYAQLQSRRGAGASMEGSTLLRLIDEFRDRFLRYVATESPDLIHAHDWVTFEAAREGARRKNIPWIAHVHSIEIERRPEGPDSLVERLEQQALTAATAIVAPSKLTSRRIRDQYGIAPDLIEVVPNVLSPEGIDADETGRFETARVVFLGRLSHQKGLDRFLNVANVLRQRIRDAEFHVYGGGYYPVPYGVAEFHGPLSWEKRGEAFRDASILIVPSRAEPFGMVILEAMLHRVPVIYPRDSGAAEVLTSGIQVNADDVTAIADEAQKLLTDLLHWESVVEAQIAETAQYSSRGFEQALIDLWRTVKARAPGASV